MLPASDWFVASEGVGADSKGGRTIQGVINTNSTGWLVGWVGGRSDRALGPCSHVAHELAERGGNAGLGSLFWMRARAMQ
eukprot:8994042-Pyramimonas_sp.AAC.1